MDKFLERRTIEKTVCPTGGLQQGCSRGQLAVLNLHLPWARYRAAKARFDELKIVKADLKRDLDQAQLADRPYREMVECVHGPLCPPDALSLLKSRVDKLERARKTTSAKHADIERQLVESTAKLVRHARRQARTLF